MPLGIGLLGTMEKLLSNLTKVDNKCTGNYLEHRQRDIKTRLFWRNMHQINKYYSLPVTHVLTNQSSMAGAGLWLVGALINPTGGMSFYRRRHKASRRGPTSNQHCPTRSYHTFQSFHVYLLQFSSSNMQQLESYNYQNLGLATKTTYIIHIQTHKLQNYIRFGCNKNKLLEGSYWILDWLKWLNYANFKMTQQASDRIS